MSGYFGNKVFGEAYYNGYEESEIEQAYEEIGNNRETPCEFETGLREMHNESKPIPEPPPLPIPGETIPNAVYKTNINVRTIDTVVPRSPIARKPSDISAHCIARSVQKRKAELERSANYQLPKFFAFTDFKDSSDLKSEDNIFCSAPVGSYEATPLVNNNKEAKSIRGSVPASFRFSNEPLVPSSDPMTLSFDKGHDDQVENKPAPMPLAAPDFSFSNTVVSDAPVSSLDENAYQTQASGNHTKELSLQTSLNGYQMDSNLASSFPSFSFPGSNVKAEEEEEEEEGEEEEGVKPIQSVESFSVNKASSGMSENTFSSFSFEVGGEVQFMPPPVHAPTQYAKVITASQLNPFSYELPDSSPKQNVPTFTFDEVVACNAYNEDVTATALPRDENGNILILPPGPDLRNSLPVDFDELEENLSGYSDELNKAGYANDVECSLVNSGDMTIQQPPDSCTFSASDFSFEPMDPTPVPSNPFLVERTAEINEELKKQLENHHHLNSLKEMILNAARGQEYIPITSLLAELAKEPPLLNPHHRNWNQEYQTLLESPDSVHKFKELAHLAHDFVYAATTYAKIIISEQCLCNSRKTIPPIAIGGVAGGQKYLCQNIIFKFALDTEVIPGLYMYGGQYVDHESAMKAAGHELKGLCQYYSTLTPGLSYPLLANIDYKGFRMIAVSVLPLNKSTLRYGSCDSGRNVLAVDPILNKYMEDAGKALNLQMHYSGTTYGQGATICSCGDLEAHQGTDGRYYVLDFARAFPPESPPRKGGLKNPRAVYYRLLRPELVRRNAVPLSSDAFTSWGSKDPDYKKYNLHVLEATTKLLHEIIPEFACRLDDHYEDIEPNLITEIHRLGINVRHLGQIRVHCKSEVSRELLKVEMIVRVVKNHLRDHMRAKMQQVKGLSQEPFKAVVIEYFNLVLGRNKSKSTEFWKTVQVLLKNKFYNGITGLTGLTNAEEMNYRRVCVRNMVSMKRVFARLIELLGVRITEQAVSQLNDDPSSFEFVDADITEVFAQPRFMDIIDYAEAMALEKMAQDKTSEREKIRLLELSAKKFVVALHSTPANYLALYHWGVILFQQAKYAKEVGARILCLKDAVDKFFCALEMKPHFKFALIHSSEAYITLAIHDQHAASSYFYLSAGMFVRAIKEDASYASILYKYLNHLTAAPAQAFQLRGVLILCNETARGLPGSLPIFEFWGKAIIELVVHYKSLARSELLQAVNEFCKAVRQTVVCAQQNAVVNDYNCISFITEIINQVTELAFYHKWLYYFVAKLYRAVQISDQVDAAQMYMHRGLALWEYAKTEDYLQYTVTLRKAAELLEMAMQLEEGSLDSLMQRPAPTSDFSFMQWVDLIAFSKPLQQRFLSFVNLTSLRLDWCTITPTGMELICSHLGAQLEEISFVHHFETAELLSIIGDHCPSLTKLSLELCPNVQADDIRLLCERCTCLTSLNLSDCSSFTSEVIIWASQLPNLREFALRGSSWLKGTAKFLHAKSDTLEALDFSNSPIPDSELFYLSSLRKLRRLSVNCCKYLPEGIPTLVEKISSLQHLDVGKAYRDTNSIIGALLKEEKPAIVSIDASHCRKLTDISLTYMSKLLTMPDANLQDISLSSCPRISEGGLQTLARCSGVKLISSLNLAYNTHLEESCFSCLLRELNPMTLHSLYLGRCKINNNTLKNLVRKGSSIALRELSIPGTSVDDLCFFVSYTPHLEKLDLKECPIEDNSILSLSEHCPVLTELDLSKCNGLKTPAINRMLEKLTTLVQLKINECIGVSSLTIVAISDYSHNLEVLEIGDNRVITDNDITHLQNLQKLRTLVVSGCQRVKRDSLIRLAQNSAYLQHLNIDNTKLIDNSGVIAIAKYAKNLQEISARSTLTISREAYDWVKKYRPHISLLIDANTDMVNELTGNRRFLNGKLRSHLGEQVNNWMNRNRR